MIRIKSKHVLRSYCDFGMHAPNLATLCIFGAIEGERINCIYVAVGCVPQLGQLEIVPTRHRRDTTQPSLGKVLLQVNKHTSSQEVSKFVVFGSVGLW